MTVLALHHLKMLAGVALIGGAVAVTPILAAGDPEPSPPKSDVKGGKKKSDEKKFREDYQAARDLALAGKYAEALAAFKALGRDDRAEVANYIGYTYRKLGEYDLSKVWYEKALAIDPRHVRTWQYYGQWQVESGNVLKARDFLENIRVICGNTDCQEYKDLKDTIDGKTSY